jgi:endonuclease/exonuclease/phosphatase family metal-dependent hydrolase
MQKKSFHNLRILLLICGTILTCFFLISCFSSFLHPNKFVGATYLALGFPLLFIAMVIWSLLACYLFPKKGWLYFLFLLFAFGNISKIVSPHFSSGFQQKKQPISIRVLSWNVNEFLIGHVYDDDWKPKHAAMLNFIKNANADIMCFQDFVQSPPDYPLDLTKYFSDSLNYPYYYFSMDGIGYGTIIYSRFPISDSGRVKYKEKVYPESLAYVDVAVQNRKMRVYNTHLRSMYLHYEKMTPHNIGYSEFVKEDTAFLFHSSRLERLEYFDRIHTSQATLVKEQLNKTKTPFIFCADLNAVPTSYLYNQLSKNLNDAFLVSGSGIQGTYKKFNPFLRIDVVLLSPSLKTTQYHSPRLALSDHFPIITDLQFNN